MGIYDTKARDYSLRPFTDYKVVLASCTTTQCSRGTNSIGDVLHTLTVVPASSTPGAVTVLDGTTAVLTIPAGAGAGTQPFSMVLDFTATSTKGWVITCGASVHAVACGHFDR